MHNLFHRRSSNNAVVSSSRFFFRSIFLTSILLYCFVRFFVIFGHVYLFSIADADAAPLAVCAAMKSIAASEN